MENNSVRLIGTVKRNVTASSERGTDILDFALSVWSDENSRYDVFDCRLTSQSAAYAKLEGFVNAGEQFEVIGHLQKKSYSESQRVAGVMVDIRHTEVIVYVDDVNESEDV